MSKINKVGRAGIRQILDETEVRSLICPISETKHGGQTFIVDEVQARVVSVRQGSWAPHHTEVLARRLQDEEEKDWFLRAVELPEVPRSACFEIESE